MPAIGPVYQPTTYVGYEPQTEWLQQPRRSRLTKLIDWLQSDECCRRIFVASCAVIVLFIVFVVFELFVSLINGEDIIKMDEPVHTIVLYVSFALVVVACVISLSLVYLRFMQHKRFYFWPFARKEGLGRQMSGQGRNGQVSVLFISTIDSGAMSATVRSFADDGVESVNRSVGNHGSIRSGNGGASGHARRRRNA